MLKANELRIGNSVEYRFVGIQAIRSGEDIDDVYVNGGTGIPLTEDWLLKFGFEQLDRFFEMDDVILLKVGSSYLYYYSNHSDKRTELKYVHQLQNLFFTLTQQELTIQETANA